MLVLPEEGKLELIFQSDHASLSGRIARAWKDEFIAHGHLKEELLEAVARHDAGWKEADSRGFLDEATGRPRSFLELPAEAYPSLWLSSIEEARRIGPLAGYLVARHFYSLAQTGDSETYMEAREPMEAFRASAKAMMDELSGLIEPPSRPGPYALADEALDNDFRFLQLNDLLSLVVLGAHAEPSLLDYLRASVIQGQPFRAELPEPFLLRIKPWVFHGKKIEDEVVFRVIPKGPYADGEALARAIGSARTRPQAIRIEPL